MKNKRAQNSTEYLIAIILVVLVVVVVIIAISSPSIWNWFKNFLPQYGGDSNVTINENCIVKIGEVRNGDNVGETRREYISFCYDSKCDSFYPSMLYFYNDKIFLDIRGGGNDEKFASLGKGRIVVKRSIFPEEYDKIYEGYSGYTPSIKFLKILDDSYRLRNNNFLCRENEMIELKKGADLSKIPKELKFKQEGDSFKVFSDSFGYEVLVDKSTNKVERIVDKNNKEIASIWVGA